MHQAGCFWAWKVFVGGRVTGRVCKQRHRVWHQCGAIKGLSTVFLATDTVPALQLDSYKNLGWQGLQSTVRESGSGCAIPGLGESPIPCLGQPKPNQSDCISQSCSGYAPNMLHTACEAAPAQAEPLQRRAPQTGGGIDKWRHVCDKKK